MIRNDSLLHLLAPRAAASSVASLAEERQIALIRVPFALPPLLVFQNALGPTAIPRLAEIVAGLYLFYALFTAFVAVRAVASPDARLSRSWKLYAPLTLGADLSLAALLLHAFGRPAVPAALQCLHALFAAAIRWGPGGASLAAILGGLLAGCALLPGSSLAQISLTSLLLLGSALLGSRFCGIFLNRGDRAVAAERDRIARDLHDDFVQTLVAAGLRVELCRTLLDDARRTTPPHAVAPLSAELDDLHQMLGAALKDVRAYLSGMRPALRQGLTLGHCLERCAEEIFRGCATEARVSVSPAEPDLAPEVETAAFYIAREALFNARKHAVARHVMVTLECRHDLVYVTVSDDGRGSSVAECEQAGTNGHRGLRTMRERAEALGGTLRVITAPGEGTCVHAELPLRSRRIRPVALPPVD